ERLTSVAQALRTAAPARLVIGCSPMLAMGFVPQLLALFRAAHPDVVVMLDADNLRPLIENFRSGAIDVLILTQSPSAARPIVVSKPFVTGELACVLPAGHRLCAARSIHAEDLADEPFIGLAAVPSARRSIDRAFERRRGRPRIVAEATSALSACMLAAEGVGITIVGDMTAMTAVQAGAGIAVRRFRPVVPYTIDHALARPADEAPLGDAFCRLARKHGPAIHAALLRHPASARDAAAASAGRDPSGRARRAPLLKDPALRSG
ncbi:LysR substrate-binding domain-containing protein, partial [Vineibacter terrae]|uniref:LysR substrate-binding domain-containing protein n=1 Tax=Vineibacter terrae TaxID=2586908 RepID=UPI002E30138F